MRRKIILAALLLACTCLLGAAQHETSSKSGIAAVSTTTPSSELPNNELIYINSSKAIQKDYQDDLLYSIKVLKGFTDTNITDIDALSASTSLYTLTSVSFNALSGLEPPDKYKKYHDYLGNALTYLMLMEWSLAKLYETNNINYFNMSRAEANLSVRYHDQATKELGNITT